MFSFVLEERVLFWFFTKIPPPNKKKWSCLISISLRTLKVAFPNSTTWLVKRIMIFSRPNFNKETTMEWDGYKNGTKVMLWCRFVFSLGIKNDTFHCWQQESRSRVHQAIVSTRRETIRLKWVWIHSHLLWILVDHNIVKEDALVHGPNVNANGVNGGNLVRMPERKKKQKNERMTWWKEQPLCHPVVKYLGPGKGPSFLGEAE